MRAIGPLLGVAQPSGAGFDLLLLCHVASAVVSLATVAVSGIEAARVLGLRRGRRPPATLLRYYAPGVNWAGRTIFLVPIFGFGLVAAGSDAYDLSAAWLVTGMAIWVVAAALSEILLWPSERRIQRGLHSPHGAERGPDNAEGGSPEEEGSPSPFTVSMCRRAIGGAGLVTVLLLAAIVVMIVQPA